MSNNPIAIDGAFSIYERDFKNYKRDSQRTLKAYYYRKHPLAKQMKEWFTLRCILILAATLFATHTIYA